MDCSYTCKEFFDVSKYDNVKVAMSRSVYIPSHDSYILLQSVQRCVKKQDLLLEIGSGSGYVIVSLLKKNPGYGVATDISPCSVEATKRTAILNNVYDMVDVVQCNSASCIRSRSFDIVLFNPPYLPVSEKGELIQLSWSGGEEGVEVALNFLKEAVRVSRKSIVMVISSLQNLGKLINSLQSACSTIEIENCQHFFYETICCTICQLRT